MVDHPAKYRWSSYAANALGDSNAILSQHDDISLGSSASRRQQVYLGLFDDNLSADVVNFFRQSLQSGTPLGNDQFKFQIEAVIGRKVGWPCSGQPKKE